MVTPLFRPTIDEALSRFLDDQEGQVTRTVHQQQGDIIHFFRQYLEQDGHESLPEPLRERWKDSARQERFARLFHTPQLLPAVPGFIADLEYQKAMLPPGTVTNAEKTLHLLARWLLARGLCSESDYLITVQCLPHLADQLDPAELFSSLLYDQSRDDPPLGKVLQQLKGYLEVTRVMRGNLHLLPIDRTDVQPSVKVSTEASGLARPGWWVDAQLVLTPHGWNFLDVGNVLP
jgi:hypothetical protein